MKDYDLDLTQVLWVEDDPLVIEQYPLKAENFGLQLVAYPCWDDAKAALENDFDRWSAIILDAKCKHHTDSEDNAIRFLGEALKDITLICDKRGRVVPWYVLTGGDSEEVSDSINDDRMTWDADWTNSTHRKYYSKNIDNDILYRRVRNHARISPRLQIQQMYKEVFNAIEECGIDDMGYNALEDLLIPIHFPDTIVSKDYNDKFEKAREVLEYIFRSMATKGLLPDWGKQVNFAWSSCILSGMPATNTKGVAIYESRKRILPMAMTKTIKAIVNIIPPFCHSENNTEENISKKEYMEHVHSSTFLLKSFTLQLCDLILFYRSYIREYPDDERNRLEWDKV